jgi:hypothetical protein
MDELTPVASAHVAAWLKRHGRAVVAGGRVLATPRDLAAATLAEAALRREAAARKATAAAERARAAADEATAAARAAYAALCPDDADGWR